MTGLAPEVDLDLPSADDAGAGLDLRLGDTGVDLDLDGLQPDLRVTLGGRRIGLPG